MKIKIFLNLLFILLAVSAYNQNYKPIVTESSNWSILSGNFGSYMKVCDVITTHYKFAGDTIIDAKRYAKVISSTDSLKQNWQLTGFIREDTSLKKVWFRGLKYDEGLIYDFDVTLGSVITLDSSFYENANIYTVIKIDSVLIQSEYRKVYTLSITGKEERWIEGIGSEFGLFHYSIYQMIGSFRLLLCFSDNNIEYINSTFQTCYKSGFSPSITNKKIDTAYLNQEYSYQIKTTQIYDYDSITYSISIANVIPKGISVNNKTGL